MNDLTLLYYSSNVLGDETAKRYRDHLIKSSGNNHEIISVTQRPIDFGKNICVGDIGQSYYNIYKQMYIGVKEVKTKYVAMAEDDTLYVPEHFKFRPSSDNVFAYNKNMMFLDDGFFWTRGDTGMFSCIVNTKCLLRVLKQRFDKYPEEPMPRESQKRIWAEPGNDTGLGFDNESVEYFETEDPLITLCYWSATHGRPKSSRRKTHAEHDIPYWGNAAELRSKMTGA